MKDEKRTNFFEEKQMFDYYDIIYIELVQIMIFFK